MWRTCGALGAGAVVASSIVTVGAALRCDTPIVAVANLGHTGLRVIEAIGGVIGVAICQADTRLHASRASTAGVGSQASGFVADSIVVSLTICRPEQLGVRAEVHALAGDNVCSTQIRNWR